MIHSDAVIFVTNDILYIIYDILYIYYDRLNSVSLKDSHHGFMDGELEGRF